MNKKRILIFIIVLVLAIGGYVVFILKSGAELNESSPLNQSSRPVAPVVKVKDNLETMNKETRRKFEEAVAAMKEKVMEMDELKPMQARLLAQGDFMPRIHSVEGRALLIKEGSERIVRFENFQTDNGPQLHIYLSADLSANDFIDLGNLRATKGNVNYAVPGGTDTGKYRYVLVWCRPFGVLFSYADLRPL